MHIPSLGCNGMFLISLLNVSNTDANLGTAAWMGSMTIFNSLQSTVTPHVPSDFCTVLMGTVRDVQVLWSLLFLIPFSDSWHFLLHSRNLYYLVLVIQHRFGKHIGSLNITHTVQIQIHLSLSLSSLTVSWNVRSHNISVPTICSRTGTIAAWVTSGGFLLLLGTKKKSSKFNVLTGIFFQ